MPCRRDHARQTLADRYIEQELGRRDGKPWRVLDLGCGTGSSVDVFRARDPEVSWVGIDVPGSPEAQPGRERTPGSRPSTGSRCRSPTAHSSLCIASRYSSTYAIPSYSSAEVCRVLVPGGWFPGTTSQLEAYHSLSMWNYTPVGIVALLEQAGLRAAELRPGIDGFTLIAWRVAGGHRCFHRWWGRESPFNRALNGAARGHSGRHPHAQRHEAAVLRTVRVPGPTRTRLDVIASEQPRARRATPTTCSTG